MNRRERLVRTMQGEPVDRPPVCFYEINGYDEQPEDSDSFNIFSDPSWKPLIELARDCSDRIVMRGILFHNTLPDPVDQIASVKTYYKDGSRHTIKTIQSGNYLLTERTRQDPDVNTVWTEEHLLKSVEDLETFLSLPAPSFSGIPDIAPVIKTEHDLGDTGIVMIDMPDPLCLAAGLFNMAEYTVIALMEQALFHKLLDRFAMTLWHQTEAIAKALPGRLWRIFGPEYASPPFLPPHLFKEYVVAYDTPMVEAIQRFGGFARLHCHGKIKSILDDIASTGCTGLDPLEPPPQGDVQLSFVRERVGKQMILFGNLEACDIERLPTSEFEKKIRTALEEGTAGEGRGFVLMPSACPYGRHLSSLALKNYEKMIEVVEKY